MTIPLTPTEQRLFDLLSDGRPHDPKSLIKAVDPDSLVEWGTVYVHVRNIRGKVKAAGLDIVPRMVNRAALYQLVRVYVPEEVGG